jgi:hypothetical protein
MLQLPVLMLAGEAAHKSHFSTTHGAYETGIVQANKIINAVPAVTTVSQKSKY